MVAEERFNYFTSIFFLPGFEFEGDDANWERKLIDAVLRRFHKFKGQRGILALEWNSNLGHQSDSFGTFDLHCVALKRNMGNSAVRKWYINLPEVIAGKYDYETIGSSTI